MLLVNNFIFEIAKYIFIKFNKENPWSVLCTSKSGFSFHFLKIYFEISISRFLNKYKPKNYLVIMCDSVRNEKNENCNVEWTKS